KASEGWNITYEQRRLAAWIVSQSSSATLRHPSSAYRPRISGRFSSKAGNLKDCPTLY
ncbi:hypothetical protein STEG23_019025, partial [Scotinomys teguina]